jgi:hypothetical protein
MPFVHLRPPELELVVERTFILDRDLAVELADHCAAVGDDLNDFVRDAIVLALDQARALREAADV